MSRHKYNTRKSLPTDLSGIDSDIQLNPDYPIPKEMHPDENTIGRGCGHGCGRGRSRGRRESRGTCFFYSTAGADDTTDPAGHIIESAGGFDSSSTTDSTTNPANGIVATNYDAFAILSVCRLTIGVSSISGAARTSNTAESATSSCTVGTTGCTDGISSNAGCSHRDPTGPAADIEAKNIAGITPVLTRGLVAGSSAGNAIRPAAVNTTGEPSVADSGENFGNNQGNSDRGGRDNATIAQGNTLERGGGTGAGAANGGAYDPDQNGMADYGEYEQYPRRPFFPRGKRYYYGSYNRSSSWSKEEHDVSKEMKNLKNAVYELHKRVKTQEATAPTGSRQAAASTGNGNDHRTPVLSGSVTGPSAVVLISTEQMPMSHLPVLQMQVSQMSIPQLPALQMSQMLALQMTAPQVPIFAAMQGQMPAAQQQAATVNAMLQMLAQQPYSHYNPFGRQF